MIHTSTFWGKTLQARAPLQGKLKYVNVPPRNFFQIQTVLTLQNYKRAGNGEVAR